MLSSFPPNTRAIAPGDRNVEAAVRPDALPGPLTPGDSLARLVEAARLGDRDAFGRLYERHARMVHGILLARVSRSDARDLVQEVFLVALERLSTLHDDEAFSGWIATIARRRAIDHGRRARHELELPDNLTEPRSGSNPPQADVRADAQRALDEIRALPETYRETLLLRFVEGLTGPEISALTGLTPGSVRVNLHRGMKLLRERLEGREGVAGS